MQHNYVHTIYIVLIFYKLRDIQGNTLLLIAAMNGQSKCVQFLLDNKVSYTEYIYCMYLLCI